jgi:hypothetical protein
VSHYISEHEIIAVGERKIILDVDVKNDMKRSALQQAMDLVSDLLLLFPTAIQSCSTEPGPFRLIMNLPSMP